MKQIFSWTVGSFFRTIGRTIAVLLMGGLLYYILASNGIGIEDLFLDHVSATSTGITPVWQGNMYDSSGTQLQYGTFGFKTIFDASQGSGFGTVQQIYFNQTASTSGGGLPIPDGYDYASFRLAIWNTLSTTLNGDFSVAMLFWTQTNWGAGANCEVISDSSVEMYASTKIAKMYVIKCPILNGATALSAFNVSFGASNNAMYNMELSGDVLFYKSISTSDAQIIQKQQETINAVQNQTQQQQQQHNETMNYLNDDNTTQAEDNAESFFGNFTVPDVGGLSAIVTAPLNTIRSLLSSTCTNLVLPLPYVEEDLTLPCMNSIYTEHFGLFFQLYQTIILALISYRCIRSIYFDIHGFTDPTDDRIEVMDL